MFRFLHSADWQLGARFTQFGEKANALRSARLQTLRRMLEVARDRSVDAVLIAGDLFEDNQVDDALVTETVRILADFSQAPIFILPGNHDPYTGPECVWQRPSFLAAPSHVRVLAQPGVTDLGGNVFLLASPLQQKLSTVDPSLRLVELASTLPPDAIKIGLTHGALAIEGRHAPNDFPIALQAASRAGLAYLGVGHWHGWLADTDGGRIVMPGTPEPDQFDQDRSGSVAFVELGAGGVPLRVEPVAVSTLRWRSLELDFLSLEASRATLAAALAELRTTADRSVVRVTLKGTVSPPVLGATRSALESELAPFLVGQIVDRTRVALSAAELAELTTQHPLLAQTLADIDRLEALATGAAVVTPMPGAAMPLTLAEAQSLLGPARIDLASLSPEFFSHLRQMVLQTLQEVAP